jgi:hypothetical protein
MRQKATTGGAGALGTETGKGLRVAAFLECGDRQHFRRRHHSLTATAMYAYLEHYLSSVLSAGSIPLANRIWEALLAESLSPTLPPTGLRMRLR